VTRHGISSQVTLRYDLPERKKASIFNLLLPAGFFMMLKKGGNFAAFKNYLN
jgi:hypothetical protein